MPSCPKHQDERRPPTGTPGCHGAPGVYPDWGNLHLLHGDGDEHVLYGGEHVLYGERR